MKIDWGQVLDEYVEARIQQQEATEYPDGSPKELSDKVDNLYDKLMTRLEGGDSVEQILQTIQDTFDSIRERFTTYDSMSWWWDKFHEWSESETNPPLADYYRYRTGDPKYDGLMDHMLLQKVKKNHQKEDTVKQTGIPTVTAQQQIKHASSACEVMYMDD